MTLSLTGCNLITCKHGGISAGPLGQVADQVVQLLGGSRVVGNGCCSDHLLYRQPATRMRIYAWDMSKILQRIQLNNQSINIGFCPNVHLTNVFSIKQQRQNEVQVRQYFHSPIHIGTLRKMGKNLNLSVTLVQILRSTIKTTNL